MSEVGDAVTALLRGHAERAGGRAAGTFPAAAADLAAHGWTRVGLPEALGGNGGTLKDAADAVTAAAYLGAATPLADQVLVTNAAAALLGIALPETAACVLPAIAEAGAATRVPWASSASHLLVADRTSGVRLVAARDARITTGTNLAGFPSDAVVVDSSVTGTAVSEVTGADAAALLTLLGALARSVQISAALRRCQDLSVTYAQQRRQFGRPLAGLPVIQQELASLAGEVAAAGAASRMAVEAVQAAVSSQASWRSVEQSAAGQAIAAAKARTGLAATAGARIAHQVHGAIGITREYELHVHTRSVWAWRDEYGAERMWAQRLGRNVRKAPGGLWASVVPAAGAAQDDARQRRDDPHQQG